jgi:hypothetical protein
MESWTPVQIRDALLRRGYDLGKYSFPMAMIHTTLKSLVGRGVVFREVLARWFKAVFVGWANGSWR